MKFKILIPGIVGVFFVCRSLLAQDAGGAAPTNSSSNVSANVSTNVSVNVSTNVSVVSTNATLGANVASTDSSITTTNVSSNVSTNVSAVIGSDVVSSNTVVIASTNVAGSTNTADAGTNTSSVVIPLLVMDDSPLPDAIKYLARLAGLNYMLDPKVMQLYGGAASGGGAGGAAAYPTVTFRWENLTAEQALNALLLTYNLSIVDDPKTKVSRITVKDPLAPDPLISTTFQLKYADPTNILAAVATTLLDKRSRVVPDLRTSQLVVLATEKEMDNAAKLVVRLDRPTPEVLIEARLVETAQNPTSVKGIDWSGTLSGQHITFGNGTTTGTTTQSAGNTSGTSMGTGSSPVGNTTSPFISPNPVSQTVTTGGVPTLLPNGTGSTAGSSVGQLLTTAVGNGGVSYNTAAGFNPATGFLSADGLSVVLSFLNSDAQSSVISVPRAVTQDNVTAELSVTTAYPIFQTTAGTQGSPGGATITYTNLGTILHVTPRISANNTVSLKVIPEVSSLSGVSTKTVAGQTYQADIYSIRHIETQVLIPSGNTLVMGGLMSDSRGLSGSKVPIIGDLPGIGAAFRQNTKTQNKDNLIIFVTPTIVSADDYQPAASSFLRTKVPREDSSKVGPWDGIETKDWSKLFKGNSEGPVFQPLPGATNTVAGGSN